MAIVNRAGAALLCLLCVTFAGAEERFKPSGPLFSTAFQYFILPGAPLSEPLPGARFFAGYEFSLDAGSLTVGIEGGFSQALLDPSVPVTLIPFSLQAAWFMPLGSRLALGSGLSAGDMIFAVQDQMIFSFSAGARLYAEWLLWQRTGALGLYIGAGADWLFESNGSIALPAMEAGLRFRLNSPWKKPTAAAVNGANPSVTAAPEPAETAPEEAQPPADVPHEAASPAGADRGRVLEEFTVYYRGDVEALPASEWLKLDNAAAFLAERPEVRIVVAGHTALTGAAGGRLAVSLDWARTVMAYLATRGVDAGRMEIAGYGADRPAASNDAAPGRALNRRVEIILIEE
ncbi:MAG: OmpA family protein [Treponema sp.]|jgi:outer membrane protein OmpA-like peptidoglycan-associated protein|nr:OmpA family protein [Treponema sp.]